MSNVDSQNVSIRWMDHAPQLISVAFNARHCYCYGMKGNILLLFNARLALQCIVPHVYTVVVPQAVALFSCGFQLFFTVEANVA
jgi:hypothetical protein